jgi:hypothetical protein
MDATSAGSVLGMFDVRCSMFDSDVDPVDFGIGR